MVSAWMLLRPLEAHLQAMQLLLLLFVDIDIGQMAICACVCALLSLLTLSSVCVQIENLILNLDHNICISG